MDMNRWTASHAIVTRPANQIAPSDGNLQSALTQKGWFKDVLDQTEQRQTSTRLVEGAATGDQWPEFMFMLDPDYAPPKPACSWARRHH